MLLSLLNGFASLFEASRPQAAADRRVLWPLALLIVAGAVVRFWGLGAVGLHGDEDTMAMATMHIVHQGAPLLPSGMFYPRGIAQLYLMAASVEFFGQSEWALRLPSALCGLLLIYLAWAGGKRFLTPVWSLALAAAVAFLPDFIEEAQTARMYVFLVTSVAAFMVMIFEWERSGRLAWLLGAVVVIVLGIQFHTLAVFAAFIALFPGLLSGDRRKLALGVLAFVAISLGFLAIDHWNSARYPQEVGTETIAGLVNGPLAGASIPHVGPLWLLVIAAGALALSAWVVGWRERKVVAVVLIATGLLAQVTLFYHIAALLIVAGLVVAWRDRPLPLSRVALLLTVSACLFVAQGVMLHERGVASPRQIFGAMLGWPSVWPFLAIASYSWAAGGVLAVGAVAWLWRVAHREPIPDHALFVLLGVWIPLIMIGFMRWDIPPRYAEAQIMPLLLGAFAAAQWLFARLSGNIATLSPRDNALSPGRQRSRAETPSRNGAASGSGATFGGGAQGIAAAGLCVLAVNPLRLGPAIEVGYSDHPDHKGAAEFIAALHPGPRDILVAEDVLQQTYYLGRVDYWLVNRQVAAEFMHRVKGQWLDFYTNTPLIGTGQQLRQLLERPGRGAVYVIGSGENQSDGRKLMRAFGISEELNSPQFHVVYRGRDGLTQVWKADPPQQAAAAARR